MNGKTVVMTGATSGIGAAAAETLASRGARIVFTARDQNRGRDTLARLSAIAPQAAHSVHYADLSSLSQTKRVAAEIAAAAPRIDVLLNNAGMIADRRRLTEDGLELTFATNHMAYFVLTCLLRERLAADARIVNTSSEMHAYGKLDFDDLQMQRRFSPMRAYSNSKLCNVMFTRELARRTAGTGLTVACFHPGFVNSRFGRSRRDPLGLAILMFKYFALTPRQGAQTLIYLASAPRAAGISGAYFVKSAAAEASASACDDEAARRLWEASVRLSGVDWPGGW